MNIKRLPSNRPALIVKGVFGDDDSEEDELEPKKKLDEIDEDQIASIDKLAEFVARNGMQFEEMTRIKNPYSVQSPFRFLHDTSSAGYRRYQQQLRAHLSTNMKKEPVVSQPPPLPSSAGGSEQPVIAPPRKSRWSTELPSANHTATRAAEEGSAGLRPDTSSSLEAMERYAKEMERREAERMSREDDDERRRKASAPLLNETSFDRRKIEKVITQEGKVGHHLQDFISKEQMASFLSKQSNPASKAAAEVLDQKMAIPQSNIGHRLLEKMGWKAGEGLGENASGITAPLTAAGTTAGQQGLGASTTSTAQDEFELYRQRMTLGYSNRPNPLGNPRKSYY